jgi:hypothetical protein
VLISGGVGRKVEMEEEGVVGVSKDRPCLGS